MNQIIVIASLLILSACSSGPTYEERLVAAEQNDRRAELARQNADFRQSEHYEREAEKHRNYQYSKSEKNAGLFDLLLNIVNGDD
jgi:hypothetical protein